MTNALKIFGFTILVSLFYSYVGQMVPQKITYPPEDTEMSADMTTDELVAVGQELVEGKGTCLSCHTIGESGSALRFPDLGGIGAAAATRRDGMDDVAYLAESLYEPNVFIVEGFSPGMPAVSKPPIALTDDEIMAVIAYLQSLGGTPSVTMQTEHAWLGQGASAEAAAPASTPAAALASMSAEELFETYLCATCHSLDGTPGAGPSLQGVGERLTRPEIYEALIAPDATVAEGYAPGVMKAMLDGSGFYTKVSAGDVQKLVDWLAEQ